MNARRARRSTRGGFSLAELVVSTSIVALLMTGVGSAMLIAARGLDMLENPTGTTGADRAASDRLLSDVSLAVSLTATDSAAITLEAPDRDNDGNAEQIRYAWSGVAGEPLTYSINGGTAVELATDVQEFEIEFDALTVDAPTTSVGSETLLISHDDAPLGSFIAVQLSQTNWYAQFVRPTLPANAVSWKITRIDLYTRRTGANAAEFIGVYAADDFERPTGAALVSSGISGLATSFAWLSTPISGCPDLDPTRGVCIVLGSSGISTSYYSRYMYETGGAPMPTRTHYLTSTDAGVTWSDADFNKDLRFKLYGTITTQP